MVGGLLSLSTYVYHSTLQSSLDNNYIQIQLCNFHVRSPAKANKFHNKLPPNQLHRHRNLAIDTRHAYMHFLKTMKGIGFKSSTVQFRDEYSFRVPAATCRLSFFKIYPFLAEFYIGARIGSFNQKISTLKSRTLMYIS